MRIAAVGSAPAFVVPDLTQPTGGAIALYVVIGALTGVASVYVTRAVYGVEDAFEKLPVHWMWWPAIGAVATGVGYDNIGVVTRRNLVDAESPETSIVRGLIARAPVATYEDESLRQAADRMVIAGVGRLPVMDRARPAKPVGMITRSDLLAAHAHRLDAARRPVRSLSGAR